MNQADAEMSFDGLSLLEMTYDGTKGATSNYASAAIVMLCSFIMLLLDI